MESLIIPINVGYPTVIIQASEFDPNSLVIILPPEACGKVTLPRSFFSDRVNEKIPIHPDARDHEGHAATRLRAEFPLM